MVKKDKKEIASEVPHEEKKSHGFVAHQSPLQEFFGKIKFFFQNPSYPRTIAMIAILIVAVSIPVTVGVLSKTTHIFNFASTSGCNTYSSSSFCLKSTLANGECTASNGYAIMPNTGSLTCGTGTVCCGKICPSGTYRYCIVTTLHTYNEYYNCTRTSEVLTYNSTTCGYKAPTPTPAPCAKLGSGKWPECQGTGICVSANGLKPLYYTAACPSGDVCCGVLPPPTSTPKPTPTPIPHCATTGAQCVAKTLCTTSNDLQSAQASGDYCQPNYICCKTFATPTPANIPSCTSYKFSNGDYGMCAGTGLNTQCLNGAFYAQGTATDCNNIPGTICCDSKQVIKAFNSKVICDAPYPNKKVQGTCYYNVYAVSGNLGPSSVAPIVSSGLHVYYNATIGSGSSACSDGAALINGNPYANAYYSGLPTACMGSTSLTAAAATTPTPTPIAKCPTTATSGSWPHCIQPGICVSANGLKPITYNGCINGNICCTPINPVATSNPAPTTQSGGGGGGSSGGGGGPSCTPGLSTKFAMDIKLPGIGTGTYENSTPKHPTKHASIAVYNNSGTLIFGSSHDFSRAMSHANGNGKLQLARLDLGTGLVCGNSYQVAVKIPGYVTVKKSVTYGDPNQTIAVAESDLIPGDIVGNGTSNTITPDGNLAGDDVVDISDYNIFRQCHDNPGATYQFTNNTQQITLTCSNLINLFDFQDGGVGTDSNGLSEFADNYNLWLRGFLKFQGH